MTGSIWLWSKGCRRIECRIIGGRIGDERRVSSSRGTADVGEGAGGYVVGVIKVSRHIRWVDGVLRGRGFQEDDVDGEVRDVACVDDVATFRADKDVVGAGCGVSRLIKLGGDGCDSRKAKHGRDFVRRN